MLVNQKNKTLYIGKSRCWPNVGPMLFNQPNINNFNSALLYVGPPLALRCKANTIKGVAFQISSSTCWCWPNVGPTLCTQRQPFANGTTFCQRWPSVVMLSWFMTLTCMHVHVHVAYLKYCLSISFVKHHVNCKAMFLVLLRKHESRNDGVPVEHNK